MCNVQLIVNDTFTAYPGFDLQVIDDTSKAVFTEDGQQSDAGFLAIQKLELSGLMDVDLFTTLLYQPQLFQLSFSDGTMKLWGDQTRPVVATGAKREKNATQLTFERRIPCFEF